MRFDKRPRQANIRLRHPRQCFCVKVCIVMRTIIVMHPHSERNRADAHASSVTMRHLSPCVVWWSLAVLRAWRLAARCSVRLGPGRWKEVRWGLRS